MLAYWFCKISNRGISLLSAECWLQVCEFSSRGIQWYSVAVDPGKKRPRDGSAFCVVMSLHMLLVVSVDGLFGTSLQGLRIL